MKHTPGPWTYKIKPLKSCPNCNPNPGSIAHVMEKGKNEYSSICDIYSEINQKANARLIASSPTMYQYILRKSIEGDLDAKQIIDKINA